jgi:hypothetical protein
MAGSSEKTKKSTKKTVSKPREITVNGKVYVEKGGSKSKSGGSSKGKPNAAKAVPGRMEIDGRNYTKKACSPNKETAKKEAKAIRADGKKLARVVEDKKNKTHCVMVRNKGK